MKQIDVGVTEDIDVIKSALSGYQTSASSNISRKVTSKNISSGIAKRTLNLTGAKTLEGRARSQANLRKGNPKKRNLEEIGMSANNPMDSFLLDDEEKAYYTARREVYINDLNLNESSDMVVLDQVLKYEIIIQRLNVVSRRYWAAIKADQKTNITNPEKDMADAQDQLSKALKLLGSDRPSRHKMKETTGMDIASLAHRLDKMGQLDADSEFEVDFKEANDFVEASYKTRAEAIENLKLPPEGI